MKFSKYFFTFTMLNMYVCVWFKFKKHNWTSLFVSVPLAGSTTLQLTPMRSITDLVNSEISDLIHSKGYFKGSSNSLDHVLTNVIHCEITLSALGGLIGHLNRLMV